MKQRRPFFKDSRAITDMHNLRLMALLQELLKDRGLKGTAQALGVDPRTLATCVQEGRLSKRVQAVLNKGLQYGLGSAAAEQMDRNDRLEARLDNMEEQVKESKENLRTGLKGLNKLERRLDKVILQQKEMKEELRKGIKRLRMSLDGVRKYYARQRRLIEQRLLVLEAGFEGTETGAPAGGKSEGLGKRSGPPGTTYAQKRTEPTLAELGVAEERMSRVVARDFSRALADCDERAEAPTEAETSEVGPAVSKEPRPPRRD